MDLCGVCKIKEAKWLNELAKMGRGLWRSYGNTHYHSSYEDQMLAEGSVFLFIIYIGLILLFNVICSIYYHFYPNPNPKVHRDCIPPIIPGETYVVPPRIPSSRDVENYIEYHNFCKSFKPKKLEDEYIIVE